jgi:hypothetical protein
MATVPDFPFFAVLYLNVGNAAHLQVMLNQLTQQRITLPVNHLLKVLCLKPGNIDLQQHLLIILSARGRKERVFPISDKVIPMLLKRVAVSSESACFGQPHTRKPMQEQR